MDVLVTIVVGGVVGRLASILMRTDVQMGLLANVVVGIGSFAGLMLADVGASLLIAHLTALGVFRRPALR